MIYQGNICHFSSPEPLGELKVYPCSVVRRRPSSKILSSETTWPIKAKFCVEPPWVGRGGFCSWHLGHMNKISATPIYGKNPSKIFYGTDEPISTNFSMQHTLYQGLGPIIVCSNDQPGVTLTYLTARSNLVAYAFEWRKLFQSHLNLLEMTNLTI